MAINPDHVELAELATELIKENGSEMTLRTETVSTGWPRTAVVTDETVTAVRSGSVTDAQINASDGRLRMGDVRLLIDAKVAPTTAGILIDGPRQYQIIDVPEIAPGDVSIMWKVVARG